MSLISGYAALQLLHKAGLVSDNAISFTLTLSGMNMPKFSYKRADGTFVVHLIGAGKMTLDDLDEVNAMYLKALGLTSNAQVIREIIISGDMESILDIEKVGALDSAEFDEVIAVTKKGLYKKYIQEAVANLQAKDLLAVRMKEIKEAAKESGFDPKEFALDVKTVHDRQSAEKTLEALQISIESVDELGL